MTDVLTPDLERLVEAQLASGKYKSATEVIGNALRLQVERDRLEKLRLEELRKKIAGGIEQLDRGELHSYNEKSLGEFFASVKANGGKKLAVIDIESGSRSECSHANRGVFLYGGLQPAACGKSAGRILPYADDPSATQGKSAG